MNLYAIRHGYATDEVVLVLGLDDTEVEHRQAPGTDVYVVARDIKLIDDDDDDFCQCGDHPEGNPHR